MLETAVGIIVNIVVLAIGWHLGRSYESLRLFNKKIDGKIVIENVNDKPTIVMKMNSSIEKMMKQGFAFMTVENMIDDEGSRDI